ncbi:MAG: MerR family transcriptional regulator [Sutterella sp.]|nr:MerR family transcriptional regulator [Sutterella sp.]
MSTSHGNRQYRIGDFARFLGVTPDFLKHYEEQGLLDVQHRGSGYRFYYFEETARVLEYMRLRNYGTSVRDMSGMLDTDPESAMTQLDGKARQLEKNIERETALLEEHRRMRAWYRARCSRMSDWEVRDTETHYFLPHSNSREFLADPLIYDVLREWLAWMPLVKSSMCLFPSEKPSDPLTIQWGLVVRESQARRCGIPVNDAVRIMPGGKAFVWHFAGIRQPGPFDRIIRGEHPMFDTMKTLGLQAGGPIYAKIEMKLNRTDDELWSCGRFVVPLAE